MPLDIMNISQITFWTITGGIAIYGVIKGIREAVLSRQQREYDLQWRRTKEAKALLDEIFHSTFSMDAIKMLDWLQGRDYEIKPGRHEFINEECVLTTFKSAIKMDRKQFEPYEVYILESFDELFCYFEHIQHFANRKLIVIEDISDYFVHCINHLSRHPDIFHEYLRRFHYNLALEFLDNFKKWRHALSDKTTA